MTESYNKNSNSLPQPETDTNNDNEAQKNSLRYKVGIGAVCAASLVITCGIFVGREVQKNNIDKEVHRAAQIYDTLTPDNTFTCKARKVEVGEIVDSQYQYPLPQKTKDAIGVYISTDRNDILEDPLFHSGGVIVGDKTIKIIGLDEEPSFKAIQKNARGSLQQQVRIVKDTKNLHEDKDKVPVQEKYSPYSKATETDGRLYWVYADKGSLGLETGDNTIDIIHSERAQLVGSALAESGEHRRAKTISGTCARIQFSTSGGKITSAELIK